MNIGTAKPTQAERAEVVFWCLDLCDPSEEYTVSRYQQDANHALADMSERSVRPLMVGGSGLYVRAVVDEIEIPGQYPEVRARLEAEPDTAGLYAQLRQSDPKAAERIEPENRRRIVRALEVTLGSGRKFSSYGEGLDTYSDTKWRQIGLRPDMDWLDERIERRLRQQLECGLLEDARELFGREQASTAKLSRRAELSRTARQALAYKELFAHFRGELTLEEAVELAIGNTRRFARKQMRWFRRDTRIRWVDIKESPLEALAVLQDSLAS